MEFSFPFEPYDIQLSLMRSITSCINEGKIGILESPTGTGKSMSIICATLSWLERFEAERKTNLEEQLKAVEEVGKDERIQKALKNMTIERKRKLPDNQNVEEEIDNEIDDILDEDFTIDQLGKKIVEESTPSCTKIIYATRTHSQLLQFAEEITKTRFQPRMVTLGSRQYLCINESVRALKKTGLMTERCNELRDNKASEKRQKITITNLKFVTGNTLQYVAKTCKESCPFARSDAIEDLCDQILASKLSSASHRSTKSLGVELSGNVIIIDEAHNLLETITNSHFVTLHASELKSLSTIVNLLLMYVIHTSDKKINYVETVTAFAGKACLEQYKLDNLLEYIEQTHLIMKLSKFSKRLDGEQNKKLILHIRSSASQSTLSLLAQGRTVASALISYYLINPASQLGDIIKQCRSLVLLGGTMEPSETLIRSLVISCKIDPNKDLIRRSFGHVIKEHQLLALTITSICDIKLVFTHGKQETQTILNLLVMALTRIAGVVPNGMIVFFPSYGYLEEFIQKIPMSVLQKAKPLFIERKNSLPTLFIEFAKSARTAKGALLLAVVGGKLSEGINFSDELGRTVVVVGLPYMNSEDVILKEKLKFMESEFGPRSGTEYYEAKCMHAVNQSVGRVIRHRNDYAAIVLIDLRYKNERIIKDLPSWIQPRLYNAMDLNDGVKQLQRFFKTMNNCIQK
ncbi:BMA-CHL-1 [Dirofilaria immitis]|nr:BMA-CHL-1 [Dirofilaria immitis]